MSTTIFPALIERFDALVVGTILNNFKNKFDFRILVTPDHYTPVSVRTHTSEPVFFCCYGHGVTKDECLAFNEAAARESKLSFSKGWQLMDYFIKDELPKGASIS